MGSWVAVEPSGKGLPSIIETPKPFWVEPSYRASVSGALSIIASRGFFPHSGLAGISPHHQNNYGLDAYKLNIS
jgi:hypothetical protein